jgi:hypothetical protein
VAGRAPVVRPAAPGLTTVVLLGAAGAGPARVAPLRSQSGGWGAFLASVFSPVEENVGCGTC